MEGYVEDHPQFYMEELRDCISPRSSLLKTVSSSTICRALNFALNLSRKVLSKVAREAVPAEIRIYKEKLLPLYSSAEQLVFLDETSKDDRHAFRHYAWSPRNTKAIVRSPFQRRNRLSIMAALDMSGFLGWEWKDGTHFQRKVA